jgi:hypothetical protein
VTKGLLKTLPALYSQEENPDPMVRCKFFTPDAAGRGMPLRVHRLMQTGTMTPTKKKLTLFSLGWCPA